MIERAFSAALKGIQGGLARISERAERIASFSTSGDLEGLTNDIVGMKVDIHQVEANAKVIQSNEKMERSILDILA